MSKRRFPRRLWGTAIIIMLVIAGGILWLRDATFNADPFAADAITDPPFPTVTYAMQGFFWWDSGQVGTQMDWVRMLSFNTIKQTFPWSEMQPEPDSWDFSQSDRILDEAEQRGLDVIARLGQTPDWALEDPSVIDDTDHTDAPPVDLALWETYCETVATRYTGRIKAYQIWNEPNLSREWGNQEPDAAGYVNLLARCSDIIRAIDPSAIIISAGLAPTGDQNARAHRDDIYLDAMYQANFQQYVDVVGVHAPGFAPPTVGPDDAERAGQGRWATFRRVEDLRKIMIAHDDAARQMAILEFGWTIDPVNDAYRWFAVTESQQAAYIQEAYEYALENWNPWIGLMTLIYMPDPGWTPDDEEYWWAIAEPDGTLREAFFTLASMPKVCGDFVIPQRPPDSPEFTGNATPSTCP